MFERSVLRPCAVSFAVALALGLSGCGGGSNVRPSSPSPPSDSNANLVYYVSDYQLVDRDLTGSGELVKQGDGTLVLTGTNAYTGGTTIAVGTLQIGNFGTTGSITGDVTNNGSMVFERNDDLRFNGVISGSGTLEQLGPGTLTLAGTSTYTGGTTVAGGTLEIMRDATIGSGTARVGLYTSYYAPSILQMDTGASLSNQIVVGQLGMLDNAGDIGGNVDVAVEGDTCDPLAGACPTVLNHDGGSIKGLDQAVRMMSLSLVKNSSGGTIEGGNVGVWLAAGDVTNDGADSIIRSADGIAVQILHGMGKVENTGGATITAGSTAIHLQYGGEVTNGAGSIIETTGTNHGDCNSSGDCSIFAASDLILGLTLTNKGTIIGNVQMVPTAYNSVTLWAGGSIHGDLDIGSNTASSLTLNGDAGTVQLYSNAVTGTTTFAGLFFKSGDGTWIIGNDALDTVGHTEINGGTLQVGDGGTEGSLGQGVVQIFNGALVFDRSDDVTFKGQIFGPETDEQPVSLIQNGTGTLILAGRSFDIPTFGVAINNGALQIGDGDMTGPIPGNVMDNGSLIFDRSDDVKFESTISGTGSLTQQGSGTLTLYKANTYTGGTKISNGTLRTMEALPGNVMVNTTAVLGGASYNGMLPGVPGVAGNLSNAGTVAVRGGDSTVGGDYVQSSTGTLAVSLGSKLDVTGTATLDGGTLEVTGADSGYVSNAHTDVLIAGGGVNGTFDQLVKDTGVVFTATTINYDATHAWLDTAGLDVTAAAAGDGVSYTPASMGSAVRVQGAFEQLDAKIASDNLGSVPAAFVQNAGAFQQSPNLRAAQASLESLSGELHAASAAMTFEAIDASSRALSDRFDALLDRRQTAGMWMHSLDVGGSMARSGFDGIGFQLDGWMAGSDRRIGATGVAGFAFGQSSGRQQLDGRADRNRSRSTEGMAYAGWSSGHRYVQGRVGFGHYRQDVSRQLQLGSDYQGVGTDYNGRYDVAYGESGLHFERGGTQLTPFVDLQYARIDRDAFAEQGAGGFGLRANAQVLDRWQAGLGVRAARRWDFGDERSLDFSARVEWQRTLASHGDVFDASFVGLQDWQPLTGIGLSRYSGLVGLGLDAHLSARTALKFGYDYRRGDRAESNMLTARLAVAF